MFSDDSIILELPRDITSEEILGRKLFVDLRRYYPKICTVNEVSDWANYTIQFPKNTILSFGKLPVLKTVKYHWFNITKRLTLAITPDPNALEVRTMTQHIIYKVKKNGR